MQYQSASCMYSNNKFSSESIWMTGAQISTADGYQFGPTDKQPLREKNKKNFSCKHVPHKEKPPQVVARRNARERRRVQAVNTAFVRLRKAIPYQNSRGKRVSKVKTLQNAIRYIQELTIILQEDQFYHPFEYDDRHPASRCKSIIDSP
ncbi:unnamed protein product [Phaedon cochleariae]|uniref:BHLH domain-containing protein n=1 Tax=Phaedon cochleariae TaxID=80249 RepID=A0A9N9X232_PHACE|nr:unnamed protein product [Phaedon cochleariae]